MKLGRTVLYFIGALFFALLASSTLLTSSSLLQAINPNKGLLYFSLIATVAFILLAMHYFIHAVQAYKSHEEHFTGNLRLGLFGYSLLALAAIVSYAGGVLYKVWAYPGTQLLSDVVIFFAAGALALKNFYTLAPHHAVYVPHHHGPREARHAAHHALHAERKAARKPTRKTAKKKRR